jgi:sulfide:quinone oxidoreductase
VSPVATTRRRTVVILGGGVGGIAAANELARRLPSPHRIVLVERSVRHAFAPSFLWLMTGDRRTSQITRDLRTLLRPRIEVVQAEARAIDVATCRVVADGSTVDYDDLVISLGAELVPDAVPGLAEGAHGFYTLEGAERLRDALAAFRGGAVAVVVSALPYKCPGAPHEAAMLLGDYFRRRGLRDKVDLHLFSPELQAMPVGGPDLGIAVDAMLRGRGVAFHPAHKLIAVDPGKRELAFEGKGSARYDLLVAIPPHRGPGIVRDAGLANEAGWVPVDPRTLATPREGVHAIGDVTAVPVPGRWKPDVPLMLPKAGVFAHAQAPIVARRIAAAVVGEREEATFGGAGYCMLEAGEARAGFAFGNFFAEPAPDVRLRRIGKEWHLGKALLEHWWLAPVGLRRRALQLALEWGGRAYGVPVAL